MYVKNRVALYMHECRDVTAQQQKGSLRPMGGGERRHQKDRPTVDSVVLVAFTLSFFLLRK